MFILLWILFGAIIGWIATIISRKNANLGIIVNVVVGVIGAAIGSGMAALLQIGSLTVFSFWCFVFAIIGAVLFLWIISYYKVTPRH